MGNFSKSSLPETSKKQEAGSGKGQNPLVQMKDNRAEHLAQLRLSASANSAKNDPVQREAIEEQELQMKSIGVSPGAPAIQNPLAKPIQRVENNTGLPDQLKSGVENLSGYSLDDVNVHYNSSKPSQLQAHAYAQGTDIHVAPGQEQHLPHEAWHVVQQKQGRVKATRQLKGTVNINDDAGLENEADVMGAKALQMKGTGGSVQKMNVRSRIVQREPEEEAENNRMTDSRMDALVKRVLAILGVLTAQGEDYEKTYGEKGKDLGKQGVEKAKGALLGSGEKEGPSLKEKVVKEGLKRWWATLEPEEKVAMLKESGSFFSGLFGGGSGEKEKEKVKHEEPEKPKGKGAKFESDITSQDLETLYETYKGYGKIKKKIEEFGSGVRDLAEELGADVGVKVGEFKNEREFLSKFEEQQVPYKVARLEFAFLKETIGKTKNESRYQGELEALSDALDVRLQGPSGMINNPGRFTGDKEQMAKAVDTCSIAYQNLKVANVVRNGTTSLLSNLGIGIDKLVKGGVEFVEGLLGISKQVDPKIGQKQVELVTTLLAVCNRSWYSHTSGIFAFKPDGVTEVGKKLVGSKTASQKLTAIKSQLTKPEEDLVKTESEITSNDSKIGRLTGSLQQDVTVDKALSKTRTQKGTEEYGGKQIDNSSKLAELGVEKARLALEKRNLKKKIKGDGRRPLTQVFYNAIKDLQPDDLTSLGKTITIMEQIGEELETTKHTAS